MKLVRGIVCVSLAFCACSTGSVDHEQLNSIYSALDGENKAIFKAYLPDLDGNTRLEWLTTGIPKDYASTLYAWRNPRDTLNQRSAHVSTQLSIEGTPNGVQGLRAILHFKNGNRADVSELVRWSGAQDAIIHFEQRGYNESTLVGTGCLQGDIQISAELFGEIRGTQNFKIKKKLSELSVNSVNTTVHRDDSPMLRLSATAHCEDGSSADVSCQAQWWIASAQARQSTEIGNCGVIRLKHDTHGSPAVGKIKVGARYGEPPLSKEAELEVDLSVLLRR